MIKTIEIEGKDYIVIDKEKFDKMLAEVASMGATAKATKQVYCSEECAQFMAGGGLGAIAVVNIIEGNLETIYQKALHLLD